MAKFVLSKNYLGGLKLLANDPGGGIEGELNRDGGELQSLDGELLPQDSGGGSVNEDTVLVNDIDDG